VTERRPAENLETYLPQLDGVRAIAVLLVVVQHWVANPFSLGAPFGFIGVTMFFVLSGYLISRILFAARERRETRGTSIGKSLKIFYARRFLRIFPIYYLTVFVLWAVGDPYAREAIAWLLTYTVNFYFLKGGLRSSIGHLWTLAIEEQYYLIYPFIVLFCTPRQRLIALWLMCAVAFASRIALDWMGVSIANNKYFTLGSFDSFAMGGMLAHWEHSRGKASVQAFFRRPVVGAGTVLILAFFAALGVALGDQGSARVVWFRAVISLASLYAVGLALLEDRRLGWILGNRALVFIGKISYGIYLYHLYAPRILGLVVDDPEKLSLWAQLGAYSAVTMIVASASWFLFEKPINSLKSKFKY
jgi:peptidoglycan/LPS O-acetylase OafA/YrhL